MSNNLKKILDESPTKKRGPIRISKFKPGCQHPEHNPPSMIVLEPGIYEYTCPSCGAIGIFQVPLVTL